MTQHTILEKLILTFVADEFYKSQSLAFKKKKSLDFTVQNDMQK